MKRLRCYVLIAFAAAISPSDLQAQTAPKFAVDATWPKDLPEGWITGQLGGVCTSAQDHVYVVNRRNITDEEKATWSDRGAIRPPFPARFTAVSSIRKGTSGSPATATGPSRNTRRTESCCC